MQEKKQNISPIKQRILQFAETLGISKRDFYSKIGVSRGTLESKTGITEDVMAKFIAMYPEVSNEWLLSGNGDMLRKDTPHIISPKTIPFESDQAIPLCPENANMGRPIPLVDAYAAAGFGNGQFSISEKDVKEYYVIPKFKYCRVDFMIEVSGISMYPHFNSGDIIACSIIRDSQFIKWNQCHVIATSEQGIIVKRLMPGKDNEHLKAISDNKDYPPFDIPVNEITGVAVVVGSVGIE